MNLCQPQSSFLQHSSYQLVLPRFIDTQYYSNSFTLPTVQFPQANVPTPLVDIPMPGDKPFYQPYSFSFIVTSDLQNYNTVYEWICSIGFVDNHDRFKNYTNRDTRGKEYLGQQDSKVIVYTPKGNPSATITFYDSFPVALSGFQMSSTDTQTEYVMATVSMAYSYFTIT